MALCDPGDEVIIPTPCWVSYSEMVKLTVLRPCLFPARRRRALPSMLMTLPRLLRRTPRRSSSHAHNPTGAVYSEQTLRALAVLAVEKDFYIIADEIYEKLIFGDAKHFSIASISEEVRERCVTINGFSQGLCHPRLAFGLFCRRR